MVVEVLHLTSSAVMATVHGWLFTGSVLFSSQKWSLTTVPVHSRHSAVRVRTPAGSQALRSGVVLVGVQGDHSVR